MKKTVLFEKKRALAILCGLLGIVVLDQITKAIAKEYLMHVGRLSYLGDTVRLQYTENPGAFLSLGAALPENYRFLIFSVLIPICLAVAGIILFVKRADLASTLGLVLVVGGGIGNLIDRWKYGRVIDFMNIGIIDLRTGIFNVADVAIMAGVGILMMYELDLFKYFSCSRRRKQLPDR